MFKVGLTGGIASGKSTVAAWFRAKGLKIIDADQIVHDLYAGDDLAPALREAFGPEMIRDGKIDRSLLGKIVFHDPERKARLERIIHPLVGIEIDQQCREAEQQGERVVILDIPLLFEAGWEGQVDAVWVVYVPVETQVARCMARNSFTEAEARQRIDAQAPLAEKAKKAARVIDNSGSWTETENQLLKIWRELEKNHY